MQYNDEVRYWMNEIDDARKRDQDFRENGKTINCLYDGEKPDEHPFNILYSNTEILRPSLYSQLPRPRVKERFKEKDAQGFTVSNPLKRAVCEVSNNLLSYVLDSNVGGYETFDTCFEMIVLDALLPGRGVLSIHVEGDEDWTAITGNARKFDRFYHGFATKWEDVPWIAYEEYVDEQEAARLFGKSIASKLKYTISEEDEKTDSATENKRKTTNVYQVWDKDKKEVFYLSDCYEKRIKPEKDPLGVTGFFNTPRPLMFHRKSNNLKPTPL